MGTRTPVEVERSPFSHRAVGTGNSRPRIIQTSPKTRRDNAGRYTSVPAVSDVPDDEPGQVNGGAEQVSACLVDGHLVHAVRRGLWQDAEHYLG